jgi:uncharacterized membrane protein
MSRFTILLVVALLVFALIFFTQRPDILNEIWLWLIGLAGAIIEFFRRIFSSIDKKDRTEEATQINPALSAASINTEKQSELQELATDQFKGITITALRYSDDGTTTVGLLYLNGFFYCYTLEDTYHEVKRAGETRIPAGKYTVDFIRQDTPLTIKYREAFPDWFKYHLEIQKVPGFNGVYIHSGGDHTHTKGCLLVSDSLTIKNENKFLTNSKNTYQKLYTYLRQEIEKGTNVRLIVRDEAWFAKLNA